MQRIGLNTMIPYFLLLPQHVYTVMRLCWIVSDAESVLEHFQPCPERRELALDLLLQYLEHLSLDVVKGLTVSLLHLDFGHLHALAKLL